MKVRKPITATLITLIILSFFSETSKVPDLLARSEQFYAKIKIFTSILETIQRSYIEKMAPDELLEDAITGVISNLDPHTVYLPADDFKNWSQSFEGYTGIGISFEILRGKITVMSVMSSSPAAEADIHTGDKILKINGKSALGLTREEAIRRLNGPAGLPVNLEVASENWLHAKRIQLIRERIVLESIPFAMMIRPQVGYVKIERFTSTTSRELDDALNTLERQGMRYLILDLRGNSGGYLNAAVEVADKFIPGGNIIVSTRGRLSSSFQQFYSTSEKTHDLYPVVVLVDHGSASASEIVAGAIQDLDRGLIIGKTSFGKGLVQSQYRFHDGSALLITTARYYTPSGRPIQRNFLDKSKDEYYREAYNDTFLTSQVALQEKPVFRTLLGRPVYAEGGIKPDYWIENNQNLLSEPLRKLYFSEKRYFYVFAEEFIKRFPGIKSSQEHFIKNFVVTDKIYRDFLEFVKFYEPTLAIYELTNAKDRSDIKFLIKREMGYMLWGRKARFLINLTRDHQLNEAIKYFPKAHELLTLASYLN
ncbi:MAG: S41 family peptidase [bacterium]